MLAGLYQFTPLKYACLDKCRSPLSFITEHWRGSHERTQAFRLGVHHGLFCIGCCWSLMLLMFAVGVGNLGWMLVLGALMAIEKTCHGADASALHWALFCSAGDSLSVCKRCSRRHNALRPAGAYYSARTRRCTLLFLAVRDLHIIGHYLSSEELDGAHGLLVGEVAPLEGAHKIVGAGFPILVQVGAYGGR